MLGASLSSEHVSCVGWSPWPLSVVPKILWLHYWPPALCGLAHPDLRPPGSRDTLEPKALAWLRLIVSRNGGGKSFHFPHPKELWGVGQWPRCPVQLHKTPLLQVHVLDIEIFTSYNIE